MPAPGDIVDALLHAETEPAPPPPPDQYPWASEFEIELRQRLTAIESRQAAIESHQLRSDKLVMEVQLEVRRASRSNTQLALRMESKVDELVKAIRGMGKNGHG